MTAANSNTPGNDGRPGPIAIYRSTRRKGEYLWNTVASRPFSSLLVWLLAPTPLTPNLVTFISLLWGLAAAAVFALCREWWGAWLGLGLSQMAYIFDCADGQLARLRGKGSDLGILLDFLIDEIKSYFIFAALGLRLYLQYTVDNGGVHSSPGWYPVWLNQSFQWPHFFVVLTVLGLALKATALQLTNFTRRSEYGGSLTEKGPVLRGGLLGGLVFALEWVFQRVMHYPSTLIYYIIFDRLDLFLIFYVFTYLAYTARTGLSVFLRTALK